MAGPAEAGRTGVEEVGGKERPTCRGCCWSATASLFPWRGSPAGNAAPPPPNHRPRRLISASSASPAGGTSFVLRLPPAASASTVRLRPRLLHAARVRLSCTVLLSDSYLSAAHLRDRMAAPRSTGRAAPDQAIVHGPDVPTHLGSGRDPPCSSALRRHRQFSACAHACPSRIAFAVLPHWAARPL